MEKDGEAREGRPRMLWRELVHRLAYASTLARLWLCDRIAGPLPATEADAMRENKRERLRKAFPGVDIDGIERQRRSRR